MSDMTAMGGGNAMASIVLVHGIGQEQFSADTLEERWLPDLARGVRDSGNNALADRLWRANRPGDLPVRMAFYGDVFLTPGAQGGGSIDGLDEEALDLANQLAERWLRAAAERADDERDRQEASKQLFAAERGDTGAQGARAALRPGLQRLSRIRWFAPAGFGVASTFFWRALTQVSRYLTDDTIREYAQQQVLEQIGPETRLVIGHSLGSVVAYEALHRVDHPVALLTLGSPLGLRTVIYDRLRPQPPFVPPALTRWDNLVDRDDLVAAQLDLARDFPASPGSNVKPVTAPPVDNGAKPHEAANYLTKKLTGRIVTAALSPSTA